ncbi:DUF2855 family protein [Streptosporangium carneum]|uniref:DUF2855 domain-containing protein n=1 Tax=Streptosporangium carneum TaxID=47481 RepID=A0A9W6I588_9ACTN|nr:DUF2855 family protein [Streptosporangium carneum]GLK12315.1 hypothetical protein GCM10017600_57240 [Streptosporangium carneum]
MPQADRWDLLVRRDDLGASEVRQAPAPRLQPGEVDLAVEKFALTSNNATYARLGEFFWNAFPGPEGYGRVPVWGVARVVDSRHPDIAVGGRYFGYLPMSTHHVVAPERTAWGFTDTSPQRDFMHGWYRSYRLAEESDGLDDRRTLIRPIYPASFNLAGFLARQASLGVRSVVITSASSKTAIGLADRLSRGSELSTFALTSPRNTAFVARLGLYDTVVPYDEFASVAITPPIVLVDFTGDTKRLTALHERFAGELSHTALVGYTHPEAVVVQPEMPGPKPEIFFTPAVEEQTMAEEGEDAYRARYEAAEEQFVETTASWLTVRHRRGPEAIADAFASLLTGEQPPDVSHVFSPR